MTALAMLEGGDYVRSVACNIFGMTNFEGGFLDLKEEIEEHSNCQVRLLETGQGAVVGWGILTPDRRWRGNVYLLDLFLHPDHMEHGETLFKALSLPDAKIQCHADNTSDARIALLETLGFRHEATLKRQLVRQGKTYDVLVYALG